MRQIYAPKAVFDEALELINAGNPRSAEAVCREAVERNPKDVNMLGLLGAVLVKMRRLEQAEQVLKRTVRLAPTFAKPHEDLGFVLLELERYEEAAEVLQKAVRLDPKLEFAHFNLGKALAFTGKGEDADASFEASFSLSPERKVLAQAARLHKEGNLEEAEKLYRQVLKNNPDNVDAMRMLAMVAATLKRYDDAERLLRRALGIAPDFLTAVIDLGRILKEQDRYEEAIGYFKKAIEINPNNPQTHFLLAGAYAPAALNQEAAKEYQRTLELSPRHPGALLGLGNALKTIGSLDEAIKAYHDCISVKPNNGETYWSLANLKTYRFTDEQLQEMENRVEDGTGATDKSEVNFLFALGKAYDDRHDYDRAWHYYERGNDKQRMLVQYDPVHTETINDAIIEVFDRKLFEEKSGSGHPDPAPIFILGLPRSGSTLLEQVLSSHSQVEGTSELPYLGRVATSLNRNRPDGVNYPEAVRELAPDNLAALGEDYIRYAQLHRTEGKPFFVDKMPNNFPTIGFLHLILPKAKIIDARRHPLDACVGNFRQHYARGQTFAYDLTDIGEYYLQYQRMMDHWHEVLPDRVLTVQYEEVVTDFDNQVRRILDYCRLPWEENCIKFYETERPVRTASSEQVRQPIYTGALNFWRSYETHLDELAEILEPIRDRYRKYEIWGQSKNSQQ